jgi:hypothetical protein
MDAVLRLEKGGDIGRAEATRPATGRPDRRAWAGGIKLKGPDDPARSPPEHDNSAQGYRKSGNSGWQGVKVLATLVLDMGFPRAEARLYA